MREGENVFYSDFGVHVYRAHISNRVIAFARHFDQYRNSAMVRSVDLNDIVWC
jgi:hypothetical protein